MFVLILVLIFYQLMENYNLIYFSVITKLITMFCIFIFGQTIEMSNWNTISMNMMINI